MQANDAAGTANDAPTMPRATLPELVENAVRGHERRRHVMQRLSRHLDLFLPRRRILSLDDVQAAVLEGIYGGCPVTCEWAPAVCGCHQAERLAALREHREACPDCSDLADLRNDAIRRIARALDRYGHTGTVSGADDEAALPPGSIELRCIVCGEPMVAQRKSKTTCSDACRQRLVTMRRKAAAQSQQPDA